MTFIGIDPGVWGGIGILHPNGSVESHPLPITTITTSSTGKQHTVFLIQQIVDILKPYAHPNTIVSLEKVGYVYGSSGPSSFNFGKGAGILEGVIVTLGMRFDMYLPQTWKKIMLDGLGKDKSVSVIKACRLWPEMANYLKPRKVGKVTPKAKDGEAEALLLAEYGRMMYWGKSGRENMKATNQAQKQMISNDEWDEDDKIRFPKR